MIFSELYSVYYNTVAKIIEAAFNPEATEKDLQRCVVEEAFSESVLTILPALKSGKWPLLNEDLSPALIHKPTMPLTNLEKRWLKAISEDPRVKLFGVEFPEIDNVEPLFTREDYRVYDQYGDGDPFEDEQYIKHFRLMLSAIRNNRPVRITVVNRHGKEVWVRFFPKGFEYSVKDDKIRIIATGCKFKQFNLGRVVNCDFYNGYGPWREKPQVERRKDLTLLITNERNALERAMLEHGIEWEQKGEHREHLSVLEYKREQRTKELQELEKSIQSVQEQQVSIKAVEQIEAKPLLLSPKVALQREDYQALVTAAQKYVIQEKQEVKLKKLLKEAKQTITDLKSIIADLTKKLSATTKELSEYKSIRGKLRTAELEQENKSLLNKLHRYEVVIEQNSLWELFKLMLAPATKTI